jgi:hypothetical protein
MRVMKVYTLVDVISSLLACVVKNGSVAEAKLGLWIVVGEELWRTIVAVHLLVFLTCHRGGVLMSLIL